MIINSRITLKHLLFVSVAFMPIAFEANAQIADQSRTADPARAEENLQPRLTIPENRPNVQINEADYVQAPSGADDIYFVMDNLIVEGNETFTDAELLPLYEQYFAKEVSLVTLYEIANAITLKYRNAGYVLTQVVVPPQKIDNGTPRLQVIEGRIDQIDIRSEGESASEQKLISDYASVIKTNTAVNIADLERQLILINDLPGVQARSIVSASETTPGAADLLIIVERKPYDALVTLDNYGAAAI